MSGRALVERMLGVLEVEGQGLEGQDRFIAERVQALLFQLRFQAEVYAAMGAEGAPGVGPPGHPLKGSGMELAHFLSPVMEQAFDGVWITEAEPLADPGPRIVYVNDGFCRLMGYAPEEVLGRTFSLLHGPQTSPAEVNRLRGHLEEARIATSELVVYHKDGRDFWIQIHAVPYRDLAGRVTHFIYTVRNITDDRAAEIQRVARALRILEEAVALVDQSPQALGVLPVEVSVRMETSLAILGSRLADARRASHPTQPLKASEMRVLIVDDDAFVRTYLGRLLNLEGVEVIQVESGEEALKTLEGPGSGVDLMITDLWMPGMDGLALVDLVRQRRLTFPVMLVSGGPLELSRADLDALAIEAVLTKPFTPTQFLEQFREVAGRVVCRV
jgi:PAS domain S-box-containing protein